MLRNILRNINFKGKNRLLKLMSYPTEKVVVPYLYDSLIEIDTSELIGHDIYWNGGYETDVIWILDNIKNLDGVCIDLGANIGVWSVPMGKCFKQVNCVEPHPKFREKLKKNFSLNGINNSEIYSYAIGSNSKDGILYSPPDSMRNKSASILELNDELTDHIDIKLRPLDEIFSHLKRLDFIKIDCDGSDGDIILSGKELILKYKPLILFEDLGGYHSGMGSIDLAIKVDDEYDQAYKLLTDNGYRIFEVGDQKLTETVRLKGQYANILAVPNLYKF
tara:strand:- start:442 stop:1272 length:831 start_codon:yes stop_codon:yes gene_type:complete